MRKRETDEGDTYIALAVIVLKKLLVRGHKTALVAVQMITDARCLRKGSVLGTKKSGEGTLK